MITQAQRNAALTAAYTQVMGIVNHMIPPMFSGFAASYITSHPELVRNISDACLDAADSVLVQHPPTPPPSSTPIVGPLNHVQHPSTS